MVTLCILDGFGINEKEYGNAIKLAGTPNLDRLSVYPNTTLQASGESVGLSAGQMGNSEVGHLNLGAGRVVYQDLPKIDNEIKTGDFFKNKAFLNVMNYVKENGSDLHLMGLLSVGGVHSHINHLKALVDMASNIGIKNVYLHIIMDGRDTLRDSGVGFIKDIEKHIDGKAKISTMIGRVYAMDRENRWDRVQKAYDMLVNGVADNHSDSALSAIEKSYSEGIFDEFVEPTIISDVRIKDYDGVIFYNYRTDRAREITNALTQCDFDKFDRKYMPNLKFCCMTEYSSDFKDLLVAFPPEKIKNNLSAIISESGLKQFHISETTKYAHITFFFNGGIEKENIGEERKLIDSVNVKDFASVPDMRAKEITSEVVKAIESKKYDFILVNLSNPDMIGHTGNLDSAIKAIKTVDDCVGLIAEATLRVGSDLIVTADHGNCEEMLDEKGNVLTSHTTNPVPLWLVSNRYKSAKLSTGALCNVAPTILQLLNIHKPQFMEKSLIISKSL